MKILYPTSIVLLTGVASASIIGERQTLTSCPTGNFDYDYIVVGSGAGGGPVASRLALAGFKVGVVEHGRDVVNLNTTIPLYLGRSNEDPQITLDYEVKLYNTPQYNQVKNWYPRASALGGSTVHNALVNVYQVKNDLDTLATTLGDPSWNDANMRNYFMKLEKNLYLPPEIGVPAGHGYDGWLSTDAGPTNLLTDPIYYDPQLIDIATGLQFMMPTMPLADFNTLGADGNAGGGGVILTKNAAHNRSSVRDFLADTAQKNPTRLNFLFNTLATKVLLCPSQGWKAYGVEIASGANLLPVSRLFAGKQRSLKTRTITAKYEVIVSAGVYQTPQLLKLSGIGPTMELVSNGIIPKVPLPGVGENLIDRLEISVVWKLKQAHRVFDGCKFGDDPTTDPCLKAWTDTGHTNLYSCGPGFWATGLKSDPALPYLDVWQTWAPAIFKGYVRGYPTEIANNPDVLTSIILKGHTKSRGFVRLTGNHPQDKLDINKNLFATAEGKKDMTLLREAVKTTRQMVQNQPNITAHILTEAWPGASVDTDAEIDKFIEKSAWGHHACCTAKIGRDDDPMAVLDNNFRVRGVKNLRVVDISVFPEIPGLFVTTPIYMVSEKAADMILNAANAAGWKPTP